jgi:ABC-type phosphate transport system substrate-binding protein
LIEDRRETMFKKWSKIRIVAVLGAILVALGTAGTALAVQAEYVFGSGSDVTYQMSVGLDTLYNGSYGCTVVPAPNTVPQPLDFSCVPDEPGTITTENYQHDVVSQAYPNGASIAINQLCSNVGAVSVVRNTRTARSSDCKGLRFVPYARDGLAWVCFNACHGVSNLTTAQLQGIFGDCSINNWSQVGGSAGPIKVYGVKTGSGIKSNWNSFLGLGSEGDTACTPGPDHVIRQNQNGPILANGDQDDAIFYWSAGNHRSFLKKPDGSKLGRLNGVVPSIVNIGSGAYPFSFFLSNVYCGATSSSGPCPVQASAATLRYVHETTGWICKAGTDSPNRLNAHSINPQTGLNYRSEIVKVINAWGFAALPYGPTGGSASGSSFCRQFFT